MSWAGVETRSNMCRSVSTDPRNHRNDSGSAEESALQAAVLVGATSRTIKSPLVTATAQSSPILFLHTFDVGIAREAVPIFNLLRIHLTKNIGARHVYSILDTKTVYFVVFRQL